MPDEVTTEVEKKEPTEQDVFDTAFTDAVEDKPFEQENTNEPAAKETVDGEGDQETPSVPASPANTDEATTAPQEAQPEIVALQQEIANLRAENQGLTQKMRSWEGRITAANRKTEEAEARAKAAEEQRAKKPDKEDLPETPEELTKFVTEYPELEAPIRLLAKQVADEIVKDRLGTVESDVSTVKKSVNQIQETAKEDADHKHLNAITQAHADWRDIYNSGKLAEWIKEQSPIAQREINRVVQDGETQEVIELFDEYKKSLEQTETPDTKETTTQQKASSKASALEAVPASSGGPPPNPKKVDKEDFDGAWDEIMQKGK